MAPKKPTEAPKAKPKQGPKKRIPSPDRTQDHHKKGAARQRDPAWKKGGVLRELPPEREKELRAMVFAARGTGMGLDAIAKALRMSKHALLKHFQEEMREAANVMSLKIRGKAAEIAFDDGHPQQGRLLTFLADRDPAWPKPVKLIDTPADGALGTGLATLRTIMDEISREGADAGLRRQES